MILLLFHHMTDEDQERIALALRAAVAEQKEVHRPMSQAESSAIVLENDCL